MVDSTDARVSRPGIIGPDSGPEPPFPLRMGGKVVTGFGRGSKELGIPTANIPVDTTPWISSAESGVYFGWASVKFPPDHPSLSPSAESASSAEPSTSFTAPSSVSAVSAPRPPPAAAGLPEQGWRVYPMVMSIGFNPFYKNTVRSAEVHVMRKFARDFYGCEMRVLILGFVRKELDYVSLEALVEDIRTDIEVAGRSLGREAWKGTGGDGWLWGEGEI